MRSKRVYNRVCTAIVMLVLLVSCKRENKEVPLFKVLDSGRTGLDFRNQLTPDGNFNLFRYIYFYNGSGIGAGDFNRDGYSDLFFGSSQGNNKLYLNQGQLHFKDVTQQAKIPADNGWSTGISVIDINNDGWLDIYVCRVGNYEILQSKNQLLINRGPDKNGVPVFTDKAHEYGLDFSGFSTQAAFFDYDNDGDPDMYLLNHSVHESGTFRPRNEFSGTFSPLSGDRIYRNDGLTFTDVTRETGINSTAIGYGLGIAIADINLDGYPDIYVGNDFHEDDYLYINQQNGTFREEARQRLMHTSRFTMGVDVADVNNDACPEIISMDMLAADPYTLKRSLGEDAYTTFAYRINAGYSWQYTRNNFQYNRGNGLFSETGLYSGIAATDWSWAPLWMDFNNDGLKDLFIANGIPKRMNDIDYINFASGSDIQQKIHDKSMKEKDLELTDKFPEIKLPNKFYLNQGDLSFADAGDRIGNDKATFSNGAVYADLDNDGDLDVVVNNMDAPALLYENQQSAPGKHSSVTLTLQGPEKNINAIGARAVLFTQTGIRTYEKFPVHGYMSSMEIPLQIGLADTQMDSAFLVWPDHTFQPLRLSRDSSSLHLVYSKGLPRFDFARLFRQDASGVGPVKDITAETGLRWLHHENPFVDFDREPLIPHMLSTEGPALAVADIDHNGLEDVFIGSARGGISAVFLQQQGGKFYRKPVPALENDSLYEDVAAAWADVDRDGHPDLIVAGGGNEFSEKDAHNAPRVYLNDGKANFKKSEHAFAGLYVTASCIAPCDFNGDGYTDLFIGGRAVPYQYGTVPRSYLLQNDGAGHFKEVTAALCNELPHIGFVTNALWSDIDKDGDSDLLLSLEWGGIVACINDKGRFTRKDLTDKKGWWNCVLPCDIDNDGDIDLVAGNLGTNSRLKASPGEPVRLYYNDFDDNGKKEQVLTYYVAGREIPFASKAELERQLPVLKKKFLYAADFAKATLQDLFGADKLDKATLLTADYFSSAILVNQGNLLFETRTLPWQAQLTPLKDAVVIQANKERLPDLLLMGNYYDNNTDMGRYDAGFGTFLLNTGNGSFTSRSLPGLTVKGQVRHMQEIGIGGKKAYLLARNNDSLMVIQTAPAR